MARIGLLGCVHGSSWLRKADRDPTWSVSLTSFDLLSGACIVGSRRPFGPGAEFCASKFSLRDFSFLSTSCLCFRAPAADFRRASFAGGQRTALLAILAFKKSP